MDCGSQLRYLLCHSFFFFVQYLRSIYLHGAVPFSSLSHLFCLHWGLFNEVREHRQAVQYTCEGGPRHNGYLRRETPSAFGPSFTWSSPVHSNMCYVANGKVLCAKKGPVAGHSNGERICVKVCVIVSVESGACVRSVHTANVAVRSGADMHARLKFNNRGATATKIRPYSSLHNSHTAQQAVVFSTRPFTRSSNRHLPISHV